MPQNGFAILSEVAANGDQEAATRVIDMTDKYFSTVEEAIQDLVRRGLVVDSGQKRRSQRSQSYEIVWKCTELGEAYDDRNMLRLSAHHGWRN
jgi:DNA-binding IclR family transcriptional regulator